MNDFLEELNESQRAAVVYNDGPSLVIAGAGSGKTRVLTYKIAYLLNHGYEPWNILALTFTNKAAREMKDRIARQVGDRARYLWMGTFHSIFARILRTEAKAIGFPSSFTIYDTSDSKSLIKTIVKDMQLDEKVYKPNLVLSRISQAKNHLVLPDAYSASSVMVQADINDKLGCTHQIYRLYWERCRQNGVMDFDDLLVYTYLLFDQHPEILKKYTDLFQYVLVDEYQDTNMAQHRIVMQLTEQRQRICVVGDDAQSIYSFRGANIENILRFTQLYKNAKLFKLEQNYRSTQTIVAAANSLIDKNSQQIKKAVFSENSQGDPVQVFQAYSDMEEGEIVANTVQQLHLRENESFNDFAILYRTNAQSRVFEECFRKRNIPYKIYGGLSFYQRKEIKDVISYFRLAINPNDEEALKRVINYPARGIGETTLGKISACANEHKTSLWNILCEPIAYGLNINKGTHTKLQGFRELIEIFIEMAAKDSAEIVGPTIVRQSGVLKEVYADRSPENLSRQQNIEELINGMADFVATRREEGNENVQLTDYLSEVSLLTDQDTETEEEVSKVTLMTIHSAKGLEFRNVFVVGLEENLFPSSMCMDSIKSLEEERRLFYVAITRAEQRCYLSFAKSRFRFGKTEFSSPSRFLRDIDSRYLTVPYGQQISHQINQGASQFRQQMNETSTQRWGGLSAQATEQSTRSFGISMRTAQTRSERPKAQIIPPVRKWSKVSASTNTSASATAATASVQVGQWIEHERFGRGQVKHLEGVGENCKATVTFEHAGEKQLLLKFARFKVVG